MKRTRNNIIRSTSPDSPMGVVTRTPGTEQAVYSKLLSERNQNLPLQYPANRLFQFIRARSQFQNPATGTTVVTLNFSRFTASERRANGISQQFKPSNAYTAYTRSLFDKGTALEYAPHLSGFGRMNSACDAQSGLTQHKRGRIVKISANRISA